MKKSAVLEILCLYLFLLSSKSTGQIPNVYEFCSALMSGNHRRGSESSCQSDQCQGRPGKRGHPGIRGPPGLKGDQVVQGTCDDLLEKQAQFQADLMQKFDLIPKLLYCSLGMKSGEIPDEYITASSSAGYQYDAQQGRLDERVKWQASIQTHGGAWCAHSNPNQWMQVDLGASKSVSGVVTQGRPKNQWNYENWVKTFKISFGDSVASLRTIQENGADKIFIGNTDKDTKVINKFAKPMSCRFIRLHPLSWQPGSAWAGMCFRVEILRGECFDII